MWVYGMCGVIVVYVWCMCECVLNRQTDRPTEKQERKNGQTHRQTQNIRKTQICKGPKDRHTGLLVCLCEC